MTGNSINNIVGGATWDDLRIPIFTRTGGVSPTFTNSPALGGNSTLYYYQFANNATNNIYFELQMPHGWDGGIIYPHVHVVPTTTNVGSIRFTLEYAWASIGSVYGASSSINLDLTTTDGVAWKHHICGNDTGITPTTSQNGLSSMLIGRLYHNATGTGNTFTGAVGLLAFDLHYASNTIGSNQVLSK